jgi:hypothetical protein
MGREDKPSFRDSDGELGDFVPAVFARSLEEAEEYRQLLDDHDIPAIVADEDQSAGPPGQPPPRKGFSRGVPVLVPEALLEEAGDVIAEHGEGDAFGLEEKEEDETEDETFTLDGAEPAEEDLEDDDEEEDDKEEDDKKDDLEEDLFDEGEDDDEDDEDDVP